jgi:putative copper resistance protein D
MEELAAAARLAQFLGGVVLFGTPLFFLYGMPTSGPGAAASRPWSPWLLAVSGLTAALGGLASLVSQTATMTGDPSLALDPASVWSVLSSTQFGMAIAVRIGLTTLGGLAAVALHPGRLAWAVVSLIGAGALVSFAWTGHGAADQGFAGWLHLSADVIHLLAAGVWLGALAALAALFILARASDEPSRLRALHQGLKSFSGIGTIVVALLILTGLINSWFLVGPLHLRALLTTAYGLLLVAKLVLFAGMIGLAAVNRFRLTPGLGAGLERQTPAEALRSLRRSIVFETSLAAGILAVVSVLGDLEPPSAMG